MAGVLIDQGTGLLFTSDRAADTRSLEITETVPTEHGAHTLAVDPRRHAVYAFLPASTARRSTWTCKCPATSGRSRIRLPGCT